VITLAGDMFDVNDEKAPNRSEPKETTMPSDGGKTLRLDLPAVSVSVIRVKK